MLSMGFFYLPKQDRGAGAAKTPAAVNAAITLRWTAFSFVVTRNMKPFSSASFGGTDMAADGGADMWG